MSDLLYGPGMPMGLGMALCKNQEAMKKFAAMSNSKQHDIINLTHEISSKSEMEVLVQKIANGAF